MNREFISTLGCLGLMGVMTCLLRIGVRPALQCVYDGCKHLIGPGAMVKPLGRSDSCLQRIVTMKIIFLICERSPV